MLGAGVIGSVYAGKLLQVGHDVVLLARGARLVDLQTHGLILQDAQSGNRSVLPVASVSEPRADDRFDLVLVSVRAEQLKSTLSVLTGYDRRFRRAVLRQHRQPSSGADGRPG